MQRITRGTGALAAGCVLLVAGCGRGGTADLPSACSFADGATTVKTALARAPAEVTVGGTPLSKCLGREADAADVQAVGAAYVDAASDLAAGARANPHGAAAVELGYLVGAVKRGASKTAGIHYELERRMEQELNGIDVRSPQFARGERAGEASG